MKSNKLINLADEELIDRFRQAAIDAGEATVNWLPAAQKKRRLLDIGDVLREHGKGSLLKLAVLLQDVSRFARYYAATELLEEIPQRCLPIIKENTKEFDALAGYARSCLRRYDARAD
jgi:hypothetical protein